MIETAVILVIITLIGACLELCFVNRGLKRHIDASGERIKRNEEVIGRFYCPDGTPTIYNKYDKPLRDPNEDKVRSNVERVEEPSVSNNENDVMKYFKHYPGSNVWPSSDPSNLPFDKYTCKICGYTFSIQVYGAFLIGHVFMKEIYEKANQHIINKHCNDPFNTINLKEAKV